MLPDILSAFRGCEAFTAAGEAIKKRRHIALYDMAPSQRLVFAMALAGERQVIYVMPNERAAQRAMEDAAGLGARNCVLLQPREIRFLRAVASRDNDWQRLQALSKITSGEAQLVILSADALAQRLIPRDWFRELSLCLKPGESREVSALTSRLVQMGYERVNLVEGKGQFALRGDILDIYPPAMDTPARVEFFDIAVDSIRLFDPLTQRSSERVGELAIGPASEFLVPEKEREAAARRIDDAMLATAGQMPSSPAFEEPPAPPDTGLLMDSGSFHEAGLWAHLLFPQGAGLLAFMPEAALVLDTPDRAMQRVEDSLAGYLTAFTAALEGSRAFPAQGGLLFERDEVAGALAARGLVSVMDLLHGLGGLKQDNALAFPGRGLPIYKGRLQELSDDIRAWQAQKYRIILYTGGQSRSERLAAALAVQGLSAADAADSPAGASLVLNAGSLSEGFVSPGASLVLIAPGELFGSGRTKARKTQTAGQRIEAFTDLAVGDYVVHEHHGIGIYQGTTRLQSEGVWRDYLYIQYRGSDKLYVPADQFDRVQKYIGNPDTAPALNDLSSNAWAKQKSRVKAGLKQLAFDLVKLYAARQAEPGIAYEPSASFEGQFADQFEHELTPDQEQAVSEVLGDMALPRNMDRLLCGDVGYGKTEVAMRAAFRAVLNGRQVAFLAPTTILVQQHVRTLTRRFEGFPVSIGFVSRFNSIRENRQTLQKAREGRLDILVGTHRLLSKDVQFDRLGLLIIDEEQRFGVRHKELIKNLKSTVDVLTLSATPIPRTLHMSMVGVRDMSLLETPPEDRFPVSTFVVDYSEALVRDAILREMGRQGQVFFLYNRVADIERMAASLRQLVPEARIAVAHGQMPETQLEDVMRDFYEAKFDVLLSSTIIENGLDIQNANTLIVYDADRFGLSQLYQLRGRVGRSSRAAYAFFTVRPDKSLSETAEKRLAAIKEFTAFGAGFRIAMRDLEIRGAGNIFGPEQSGQVAAVGYDMYVKMIEEAIREAQGDYSGLAQSELETRVDLKINAFLPEGYVQGETQRIEVYKRIAMIRSRQDESELIDDLVDRFGEPEEAVMNLIAISRLRALASALGADQVRFDRGVLVLRFNPQYAVDPVRLFQALGSFGRKMALQSGKHTSLLVRTGQKEVSKALGEGIQSLESLLGQVREAPESAQAPRLQA